MRYNGNKFSVYESEEKTVLGLLGELGSQVNHNTEDLEKVKESDNKKVSHDEMNTIYKIDKNADFTGSWHGIKKPTASQEGLQATVDKIVEEDIPSINEQMDNITNKANITRKFNPKIYGNLNWSTSYPVVNGKYERVDETLKSWVGCIDGIILDFQIKPNDAAINDGSTFYLNPSINWLNYVVEVCNAKNIKIIGIKFHANEIRDNNDSLNFVTWFNKYKEIIKSVTEIVRCEYLLYFNESPNLLNRSEDEINIINNFSNELKAKGFKVGFAGVGNNDYLINNNYVYDVVSFHTYPMISGKLRNTTKEDAIIAWEQNDYIKKIKKFISNNDKEVMIGEAGCGSYWECLAVPEKWNWDYSTLTYDNLGRPATLFLYGLLETFKDSEVSCVCFWYNDPMLETTQNLIKRYL